jgi:hypothetical protein
MGASICCAEAEADTQFTIFDLSALKKKCLISPLLSRGLDNSWSKSLQSRKHHKKNDENLVF